MIGNPHLAGERKAIYHPLTTQLLGPHHRPVILVDGSDYTYNREHLILRAAVPAGGRALTLYEEVHPYRCYGNARIQSAFLKTLKSLLPETHTPIIVTDAGFCGPWFRHVRRLGWDYVRRIRKSVSYRKEPQEDWRQGKDLHAFATIRPRYRGEVALVRSRPMTCHLYLYRKRPMRRIKKTVYGHRAISKHSKKNAERERAPWIPASSLGPQINPPGKS